MIAKQIKLVLDKLKPMEQKRLDRMIDIVDCFL